jgi:hypothetical protein
MLATMQFRIVCVPTSFQKSFKIKIYKTVILLVLYGCETWSLALKEDQGAGETIWA